MKLTASRRLALQPVEGVWYRAIPVRFWKNALETAYTANIPSRFNPGPAARYPFEILYLAENQLVAFYEVNALLGPPQKPIADPAKRKMLLIDVSVRLQSVADLTQPKQQKLLETTTQEMTGNWDTYARCDAPTQKLGAALFRARNLEGFLANSAKMPHCKTLIVFPQKLRQGSELAFEDAITRKTHRMEYPG
jgi:RES domain